MGKFETREGLIEAGEFRWEAKPWGPESYRNYNHAPAAGCIRVLRDAATDFDITVWGLARLLGLPWLHQIYAWLKGKKKTLPNVCRQTCKAISATQTRAKPGQRLLHRLGLWRNPLEGATQETTDQPLPFTPGPGVEGPIHEIHAAIITLKEMSVDKNCKRRGLAIS